MLTTFHSLKLHWLFWQTSCVITEDDWGQVWKDSIFFSSKFWEKRQFSICPNCLPYVINWDRLKNNWSLCINYRTYIFWNKVHRKGRGFIFYLNCATWSTVVYKLWPGEDGGCLYGGHGVESVEFQTNFAVWAGFFWFADTAAWAGGLSRWGEKPHSGFSLPSLSTCNPHPPHPAVSQPQIFGLISVSLCKRPRRRGRGLTEPLLHSLRVTLCSFSCIPVFFIKSSLVVKVSDVTFKKGKRLLVASVHDLLARFWPGHMLLCVISVLFK